MKTLLLSAAFFLCLSASSQMYIGLDAGKSSLHPVGALNVGYTKEDIMFSPFVEAKIIFHANFTDPAYFAIVGGETYRVNDWAFSIYAGPDKRMIDSDKKKENYWCALAGARITWKDFHVDAYRTNGINFFTVGYFGSLK